ncbi:hypothetical protein C8R44DRAFT_892224 [Mycena epipterygia]|nr:hypothetical protein C8R44DRAFT_892224 [Mycena epipterygia]
MSSTHAKRAKVWQTSEFNAEWIHNAVEYCRKDPDGKRGFEARIVEDLGAEAAHRRLLRWSLPSTRTMSGAPPKEGIWWAQAAFDLGASRIIIPSPLRVLTNQGVSEDALLRYAEYVQAKDIAAPPRAKPAIKRRRGEGSIAWLSRHHEAHLDGHKVPEMDWAAARAIAISEYDRVRDTWESWHTSPQALFDEILQRGKTTILSPQILANHDGDYVRLHKFDDAFRARVYSLTLAHMVWLHASELLQDLFDMRLTTSSQIEREYKKDRRLMLRLVACYTKVEGLALHLWSNMRQVVTASANIAPCLVRRRTLDGVPDIQLDKSRTGQAAWDLLNDLERNIIRVILKSARSPTPLCDLLIKALATDPHAADRFDSGAFEIFGELAVGNLPVSQLYGIMFRKPLPVNEFLTQVEVSAFGKSLMARAQTIRTDTALWDVICPIVRPEILREPGSVSLWGPAYGAMVAVRDAWLLASGNLNMQGPVNLLARIEKQEYLTRAQFDEVWTQFDHILWLESQPHAAPGQHRSLVRQFGLYDLSDPTRPTCTGLLLRQMFEHAHDLEMRARALRRAEADRAQAPDRVVVPPSQTVAQSGHAYLTQEGSAPRAKAKTRKADTVETVLVGTEKSEEEDDEDLPEFLPLGYKLGKKVIKVFHRILEEEDTNVGESSGELKKGQIRWDAFEKAMKRISFGVCQTAGSSVRFDPPAKNARPITFHRPHPDSLLTPHTIKWIGARLKPNYGWTVDSFTQGTGND